MIVACFPFFLPFFTFFFHDDVAVDVYGMPGFNPSGQEKAQG